MSSVYLNQYVERVIQAYLRAQNFDWIPAVQIHKGFEKPMPGDLEGGVSIAQKMTPLIECICRSADPDLPNFRGNWHVHLELGLTESTRDTDDATHEARADALFSLFYRDEIIADLIKIQPAFWCSRIIPGQTEERITGISFTSIANFTLLSACAQAMQ